MIGRAPAAGATARRITIVLVLVAGAVVLSTTLRLPRGSAEFVVASLVLAAVWCLPAALFGVRIRNRDSPILGSLAIGAAAGAAMYGVFVVGQSIAQEISWLAGPVRHILAKADAGPSAVIVLVALVNGVAEELYFRGALVDVLGASRPAAHVLAFVAYVVVTALVGNTALTIAAIVMGAVLAAERWFTRALVVPITTHVVWSFLVIVALPRP